MPIPWRDRAFTQPEAAELAGIPYGSLRVLISRSVGAEALFSEKRRYRRMFSAQDIAIVRFAHELVQAGQVTLTAVAIAFSRLDDPPEPDAIFVIPSRSVSANAGSFIDDREVPRMRIEHGLVLIPIGKIVHELLESCEAMYHKEAAA